MNFNEFINNRRKELNISVDELVKLSGIPKGTLSKITAGISTNPTLSTVEALCKALKCSLNDAVGCYGDHCDFSQQEKSHIKKYRTLDVHGKKMVDFTLNEEYERCSVMREIMPEPEIEIRHSYYKVSAGTGFELDEGDNWEMISIPDSEEAELADFALTIKGNSMEPIYYDGDIVLVKEQASINIGEIGIFTVNGSGYIKKYGGDRLISLNAEYDDIEFSAGDDIRCCGKVIGRVQKYTTN